MKSPPAAEATPQDRTLLEPETNLRNRWGGDWEAVNLANRIKAKGEQRSRGRCFQGIRSSMASTQPPLLRVCDLMFRVSGMLPRLRRDTASCDERDLDRDRERGSRQICIGYVSADAKVQFPSQTKTGATAPVSDKHESVLTADRSWGCRAMGRRGRCSPRGGG